MNVGRDGGCGGSQWSAGMCCRGQDQARGGADGLESSLSGTQRHGGRVQMVAKVEPEYVTSLLKPSLVSRCSPREISQPCRGSQDHVSCRPM